MMNAHHFEGGFCSKCGKPPAEPAKGCEFVSTQEKSELIRADAEIIRANAEQSKANAEQSKANALNTVGKLSL